MIKTITNTKKMDNIQSGMKSNKKVHKDLFKMMKFCAAFCCLLLCTVVNVQAQQLFGVNRPAGLVVSGILSGRTETTNHPILVDLDSSTASVAITHSHFVTVDTSRASSNKNRIRFNLTVVANNTGESRMGEITFTATLGDITQIETFTFVQPQSNYSATTYDYTTQNSMDPVTSVDSIRSPQGFIAFFVSPLTATTLGGGISLKGDNITYLDSLIFLESLTSEGGHLIIDSTNITSLSGLDNLTSIEGNLVITNNSMLTSLEGLGALTNVGGHVIISGNGALVSLEGLDALGTIGGDVTIVDNDTLSFCCNNSVLATAIESVRTRDEGTLGAGRYTSISGNNTNSCNSSISITTALGETCDDIVALITLPPNLLLDLNDGKMYDSVIVSDNIDPIVINFYDETIVDAQGWQATIVYSPENANFITLSQDRSIDQNDLVDSDLTATPTGINETGMDRTATITITTTGSAFNSPSSVMFTITQQAAVSTDPTLTLTSPNEVTLSHNADSTTSIVFDVANTTWTATSSNANIVTLSSPTMGTVTDETTVTLTATTASANTGSSSRPATITISATGTRDTIVTITQSAPPAAPAEPTLTVTSDNTGTLAHGGATSAIIFNVANATWTAMSSETFVTLDAGTVTNDTTITVTATAGENTGAERMATITITAMGDNGTDLMKTVTLTQEAAPVAPAAPTVSISTTDKTIEASATSAISVAFMVGGNATGWGSTVTGDFITLNTAMNANQTGAVTIQATPTENTGVERVAKIVISTTGPGDAVSDTLTITQSAGPPIFTLTSDDAETIAYDAESASDITFNVGGGATAWWAGVIDGDRDNNFVMLDKTSGSAGLDTIKVTTVAENTGVARVDTVVVGTGGEGEATDTIIVTQEAVPTIAVTDPSDGMITIDHDVTAAQTITFNVGGSATGWKSSIVYNPDPQEGMEGFITLEPEDSVQTGPVMVMATPTENTSVRRTATITFITTGQLGDSITTEVTITQDRAPGTAFLDIISPSNDERDTVVAYTATTDSDSVEIVFKVEDATGWESMISYGTGVDDFVTLSDTVNDAQIDTVRIKAAVMENEGVERIAMLTLSTTGQSGDSATSVITIIQRGAPPTFMLTSDNTDTIAHDAQTARDITFNVGGGATGWSSTLAGDNFITLTGEKDMRGDVTVTVASKVNTGVERSAVITIATVGGTGDALDTMITITQSAAPVNPPTLMVSTNDTTINHDATDAFEITFTLGGDARGWQSTLTGDDFIDLDPGRNARATAGEVTIMATASENTTGAERTQTITFATTGGATDMVIITQRAAPPAAAPTVSISTMDTTIEASATAAINLVFTVGGSATGWRSSVVYTPENANFITFTPTRNADEKDEVTITVTPSANTGAQRVAKIVITPTGGTGTAVKDSITITQKIGEEETDLGISLDESLTLYPNPTDGLFFIEGLSGALEVHVHDLLGRQVATYSLSAGERNVDVSALSSGMYVVTLKESGGELLTRMLIKQ